MCVKKDNNNKLKWDKAESVKLVIYILATLIPLLSTFYVLHYEAVNSLNLAINENKKDIEIIKTETIPNLKATTARLEITIEKNQDKIIELLKHGN